MTIVVFLEMALGTLFLYYLFTQLIRPLWQDTPVFPVFRKERKLRHDLVEANEELVELNLESKIAEKRKMAKFMKNKIGQQPGPADKNHEN